MVELTNTESRIYNHLKRSALSANTLMNLTGLGRPRVTEILRKLIKNGLVEVTGTRRSYKYRVLPTDYIPKQPQEGALPMTPKVRQRKPTRNDESPRTGPGGPVTTYTLSADELAKYRSLPPPKDQRRPFLGALDDKLQQQRWRGGDGA